jgi:hypothetical protein
MTMSAAFRRGAMTPILLSLAWPLTGFGQAEPAKASDLPALQADVRKGFKDEVTPFVRTYCLNCHSNRKS